jgi:hypothetical protein
MEFTTEQAKTVFDLIRTVNPYAYLLLLSLILPIFWITLKKAFGISGKKADLDIPISKKTYNRVISKIVTTISLKGDKADKVVFYICIIAFLIGGIVVKIGEYKEETLRQKTIGLKKYFEGRNLTFMQTSTLSQIIPENTLEDICYNYPNAFIKTSDSNIMCVDTIVTNKIAKTVYPLLESYLKVKLKDNCKIAIDTIGIGEAWYGNIRGFFMLDIIYGFLSQPANKGK